MSDFDIRKFNNIPEWQSVREIIDWIDNLAEDLAAHQRHIVAFNFAVHDLIAYGAEAVDPLVDRLLDTKNNWWMRWATTWVLQDIGDRRAVEPLWKIFNDTTRDLDFRYKALMALSTFQDPRTFDALVTWLNAGNHLAIKGLGNLGDEAAVSFLTSFLDEEERLIRDIVQLTRKSGYDSDKLDEMLKIAKEKFHERKLIIEALAKIGGPEAVHLLSTLINAEEVYLQQLSKYDRQRRDAAYAVTQIDHPDSAAVLRAALTHPKYGVRRVARRSWINR